MALIKERSGGWLAGSREKTDGKTEGNEKVKRGVGEQVLIRIRVVHKEHQMFAPQRDLLQQAHHVHSSSFCMQSNHTKACGEILRMYLRAQPLVSRQMYLIMCQIQTNGQLIKPYHIIHVTNTYVMSWE